MIEDFSWLPAGSRVVLKELPKDMAVVTCVKITLNYLVISNNVVLGIQIAL